MERFVDRQFELELALVIDAENGEAVGDRKQASGLGPGDLEHPFVIEGQREASDQHVETAASSDRGRTVSIRSVSSRVRSRSAPNRRGAR
jgi:hypothetical protein